MPAKTHKSNPENPAAIYSALRVPCLTGILGMCHCHLIG
jgi:hypothetical protein